MLRLPQANVGAIFYRDEKHKPAQLVFDMNNIAEPVILPCATDGMVPAILIMKMHTGEKKCSPLTCNTPVFEANLFHLFMLTDGKIFLVSSKRAVTPKTCAFSAFQESRPPSPLPISSLDADSRSETEGREEPNSNPNPRKRSREVRADAEVRGEGEQEFLCWHIKSKTAGRRVGNTYTVTHKPTGHKDAAPIRPEDQKIEDFITLDEISAMDVMAKMAQLASSGKKVTHHNTLMYCNMADTANYKPEFPICGNYKFGIGRCCKNFTGNYSNICFSALAPISQ